MLSLGIGLGYLAANLSAPHAKVQMIDWLDNPRSLSDFSLNSQERVVDNQVLQGQWTLVLFGYLHCPDVCPTSLGQLARLNQALKRLSKQRQQAYQSEVIFVSVDPGRDKPQDLAKYLDYFDPEFVGVTGAKQQVASLATSLGIRFSVLPDGGQYQVAHSLTLSIIGPDGLLWGRFYPGFDVESNARQLLARQSDFSRLNEKQ